jgi:hypothetical protein
MANFTFNLDSLTSSAGSTGTKIETNLYAKTKDEDLTYTGTDTTVWDRINGERLRRGLPSLTSLGFPRPPEDPNDAQPGNAGTAATSTTTPDGSAKAFEIKGPPGLTREQAFEIFKKQANAGGLVGFKSGDVLSAATQAADGLPEAQALVAQAQSGVNGSLNVGGFASSLSAAGVDLSTGRISSVDAAFAKGGINGGAGAFSSVLGGVASGLGAAGGALGGSLAGTAAGLTALVGPAVSSLGTAGSALVGAAAKAGSVATASIQTINSALTNVPVGPNTINVADFAKTIPAVNGIGPMDSAQVTGVLAQAKNLVGQSASTISNAKGIGEFGLNIQQLETAGYVKPGISNLLAQGASSLAAVAKSPASWTGKGGIQDLSGLLASPSTQGLIQQDLMAKGVAGLGAVGIPIKNLSAQGIAGMSLNAAKSLPNAEAFAKGLPIPGDATGAINAAMNTAVRDGAFAVNMVSTKIPDAVKDTEIPIPAVNTVSRATVDAASSRIAGNEKIPPVNYGPPAETTESKLTSQLTTLQASLVKVANLVNARAVILANLSEKVSALENQQTVTQNEWAAVDAEYAANRTSYNAIVVPAIGEYISARTSADVRIQQITAGDFRVLDEGILTVLQRSKDVKERIRLLQFKIEGINT